MLQFGQRRLDCRGASPKQSICAPLRPTVLCAPGAPLKRCRWLNCLAIPKQDANTVHCNINPETIIITKDGSYKLAGFQFAAAADYGGAVPAGGSVAQAFEYTSSQPPLWEEVLRVSRSIGEGGVLGAMPAPPASTTLARGMGRQAALEGLMHY